jgi:hypothetical protein
MKGETEGETEGQVIYGCGIRVFEILLWRIGVENF